MFVHESPFKRLTVSVDAVLHSQRIQMCLVFLVFGLGMVLIKTSIDGVNQLTGFLGLTAVCLAVWAGAVLKQGEQKNAQWQHVMFPASFRIYAFVTMLLALGAVS